MKNPFEVIETRLSNIENLILDLKHKPTTAGDQPDPNQLLNVKEAAKFLNLSVQTIYLMVSRGDIPVNRKNRRLYFLKSELTEWIKQGRQLTNSEIEDEAVTYLKPTRKNSHA